MTPSRCGCCWPLEADPNQPALNGLTPLHIVSTGCNDNPSEVLGNTAPAARLLIESGANVNAVSRSGMTVLAAARRRAEWVGRSGSAQ